MFLKLYCYYYFMISYRIKIYKKVVELLYFILFVFTQTDLRLITFWKHTRLYIRRHTHLVCYVRNQFYLC
jgi:hypothetical protein